MAIVVPESLSVFSGRLCYLEPILKQKRKKSVCFFLSAHATKHKAGHRTVVLLDFQEKLLASYSEKMNNLLYL